MSTTTAYDPIEAPCLGCSTPIVYDVIVEPYSAPEIVPPMGVVAYRGGHLCSSCAAWLDGVLGDRRARATYRREHQPKAGAL